MHVHYHATRDFGPAFGWAIGLNASSSRQASLARFWMGATTALVSQMRGLLLDRGIALARSITRARRQIRDLLEDSSSLDTDPACARSPGCASVAAPLKCTPSVACTIGNAVS